MRSVKIYFCIACFIFAMLAQLIAQEEQKLAAGDRVRIWSSEQAKSTGKLVSSKPETLFVKFDGDTWTSIVPFTKILKLEISTQRKSKALAVLPYGFFAGAIAGFFIGPDLCFDDGCSPAHSNSIGGAAVFGTAGAIIGGLIGAVITDEKWEQVQLEKLK